MTPEAATTPRAGNAVSSPFTVSTGADTARIAKTYLTAKRSFLPSPLWSKAPFSCFFLSGLCNNPYICRRLFCRTVNQFIHRRLIEGLALGGQLLVEEAAAHDIADAVRESRDSRLAVQI